VSVADITGRIAQIQAQLALLAPPTPSAGSSSAFSDALRAATGAEPPTAGSVAGDAVVARARTYLGVPYVWGGTDPDSGLDCSGLVQVVYRDLGYEVPRVSYDQARAGRPVASLAEARPGDILAFGSPVHHVGIYVGDGQMIEAPRPGLSVRVGPVYETPTAIRRVVPDGVDAAVGVPLGGTRVATGTPYAALFEAAAARHGVSAPLLAAVARQESGFDPRAVSPAGAQGLMQLMPGTADGLGVQNPFDPAQAVDGAALLLRSLLDRFGGTEVALAAYNAGPGAVLRYGGIPPYPETQAYVRAVLAQVVAA
jgi:peptidoglycan DL-endopeptidase CwlO